MNADKAFVYLRQIAFSASMIDQRSGDLRDVSITSFLPYAELKELPEGTSVQLHDTGGKTTILITVHSAGCGGCQEYLDSLAPLYQEFDAWDGRLLVIVPGPVPARGLRLPPGSKLLSDESGRVADASSASVFVADRYGQVFDVVRAGTSHELPSPRELAEWLKYLGTLCPE